MEEIVMQYKGRVNGAYLDNLTGLYNNGIFQLLMQWELSRAQRTGAGFVLAFVDIDAFDLFNQRHGTIEGDLMLKTTADIIRNNIRNTDRAARYSGDRFAVMLVQAEPDGAGVVAERIRSAVACISGHPLTVSIGLYHVAGFKIRQVGDVCNAAAAALSQAKLNGRNRVAWFEKTPERTPAVEGRILVVDDEPLNLKLMTAVLAPLGYTVITADSGQAALSLLAGEEIDLVMLDVMMPGMDGFEVCRHIKRQETLRMIPVVLVTALEDVAHRIKGIEAGADDFLTKPPNRMELIARTRSLLNVRRLNRNMTSIENVLFSLAGVVEAKDRYTRGHVRRVSELAISVGRRMQLPETDIEALRIGGALHDIGKIGVPKAVLNKPGALNDVEWNAIRKHPEDGYNICLPLKQNLRQALDVVRHHHEKLDGSGYPDGLKGDAISLLARIMAVVDIYDALTTDRAYRKAMPREKALGILWQEVDHGKLDKAVVACLTELVAPVRDAPCQDVTALA